jgi:N-methylhydantoinase A
MLNTDLRVELTRSLGQTRGIDVAALRASFAAMAREGRDRLGALAAGAALRRSADMRYGEQVFEIAVPLDGIDWDRGDLAALLAAAFHRRHQALYTYAMPEQEVVLVNARLSVIGRLPAPPAAVVPDRAPAAARGSRPVFLDAPVGWVEAAVFDFADLAPGQRLSGPALVESETTTVLLRPGEAGRFDPAGWLAITVPAP